MLGCLELEIMPHRASCTSAAGTRRSVSSALPVVPHYFLIGCALTANILHVVLKETTAVPELRVVPFITSVLSLSVVTNAVMT